MSDVKHTPGPWQQGSCDSWIVWAPRYASTNWVPEGAEIGTPEAVCVATIDAPAWAMGGLDSDERDTWLAESEANARLIAAAPDMLEAMQRVRDILRDKGVPGWGVAKDILNEAIAKATSP